ncbi:MAG: LCP family protein [Mycobacterium sp.]|nr:LCP family protein [Mycobacterium sp.]
MNGASSQRRRPKGAAPAEPSQVIRRERRPPHAPVCGAAARPGPPPPPPVPPAARRHERRWARLLGLSLLIGPLLGVATVLGGAGWLDTTLHRRPVLSDYPDRPAAGRGTNWLLVGSDGRQGLTAAQQAELATGGDIGSSRSDTLLLVHLPELGSGRPATMVSIPRDSYVPIPGHGRDKINAAFAMGGAPLLVRTVERVTGLRLDHYAEIGFGGFAALVDAVGGVTVCPSTPIDDPLAGIDLPGGCQVLDGRSALGYVRTRDSPRADLDRVVAQRQFLSALLRRAVRPAFWLNPWNWYSVPHAAADALTFDRGDHVWDLARLGWTLHAATTTTTVPIGALAVSDAGSVVVWNHDLAGKLFDALAADAPVPAAALDGQPDS